MHASLGILTSDDGHSKFGRGSLHTVRTQIIQNLKAAVVNGRCPNRPAFGRVGLGSAHDLKRKSNQPSESESACGWEGAVKQQGVKSGAGRVRNTS